MKTRQLSELGTLAEDLQQGETIEIRDGDTPVAQVVPIKPPNPKDKLPDDFFTRPRPKFASGSVLEALLEERRSGR
ncbi:MAG TPA: hypothetical protein VF698_10295 [Thermoanaerobaculia bacterium]|jgi:antitoxin (DNA-binding transcriptional repressor) of toxin-antitoxin stability system